MRKIYSTEILEEKLQCYEAFKYILSKNTKADAVEILEEFVN